MPKTFEKQYRNFCFISIIAGVIPPGVEDLVRNRFILNFIKSYAYIFTFLEVNYTLEFFVYAFTSSDPLFSKMLQFRRMLAVAGNLANTAPHLFAKRSSKLNDMFKIWNNYYYKEERETLLDKNMKKTWTAIILYFTGAMLTLLSIINMTMRPIVHGNPSTSQKLWKIFEMFTLCFSGSSGPVYHALLVILLTIAQTKVQTLKTALRTVFTNITVDENYQFFIEDSDKNISKLTKENLQKDATRVRRQLKEWIKQHQETKRWLADIKSYYSYTSSVKYLIWGLYMSLAVWSGPILLRRGRVSDFLLMLIYAIIYFGILFYESRLADEIGRITETMFQDTYDCAWFVYPADITKSVSIICSVSTMRPFTIKALSVIKDNSETCLAVLNASYKALSLLLKMDIK